MEYERYAAPPDREYQPVEYAEMEELRQTLNNAILSLRNQNYRNLLLYLYHGGMNDQELSEVLGVSRQQIYLWKFRAFQELQKNPELISLMMRE